MRQQITGANTRSPKVWISVVLTKTDINTLTLMFVSMELEARKSPNGWKPRLVMLALCPIRVLKTKEDKKQQSQTEKHLD